MKVKDTHRHTTERKKTKQISSLRVNSLTSQPQHVSGGSSRRASKEKERLDFIGSIPTSSPVMTLPSLSKQTMGRE
jgi:hypothetical protein